eukprot:gene18191-20005_t
MNLLEEELKAKGKSLKQVETTVTCKDGRKYKESCRGLVSESIEREHSRSNNRHFFVVDTSVDEAVCEVLPGLFIGSQDAATNFSELQRHGIQFILNVAVGVAPVNYDEITSKIMPIYDLPEFDIKGCFEEAVDYIKDSLKHASVLVHCNAGISRSGAVVAAYLIREARMPLDQALTVIRAARSVVKPNDGFMEQLRSYEREKLAL